MNRILVLLAIVPIVGLRAVASGQETPPESVADVTDVTDVTSTPEAEPWWFDADVGVWLPGVSGTVGVGNVTADVSLSFTDVLGDSDSFVGLTGAGYFGKGRLGGYVNGFWSKIGADATSALGAASVTTNLGIVDFGVSWEIGRRPIPWTAAPGAPARQMILRAYVGARYTNLDLDIDFPAAASQHRSEAWIDPMVGFRLNLPFARHWSAFVRADVGGFGLSSEFAWTAIVAVSWDFHIGSMPSAVRFGYTAIQNDYDTGSGTDRFLWDTTLHGMTLGFSMQF